MRSGPYVRSRSLPYWFKGRIPLSSARGHWLLSLAFLAREISIACLKRPAVRHIVALIARPGKKDA